LRLLSNLVGRTVEDGAAWFRVIDWIMALPADLNDRVHLDLTARRKEGAVAFVSYWEQKGIEKGEVIGQIRHSQKMLKIAQTPISELAARPREELTTLLAELEARFLPNTNGSAPAP
jgi:hypothetical protein